MELKTHPKKFLTGHEYEIYCNDKFKINYFLMNGDNGMLLSPGELGCACSHLIVWNEVVKNNYSSVLVLEDDVELVE